MIALLEDMMLKKVFILTLFLIGSQQLAAWQTVGFASCIKQVFRSPKSLVVSGAFALVGAVLYVEWMIDKAVVNKGKTLGCGQYSQVLYNTRGEPINFNK